MQDRIKRHPTRKEQLDILTSVVSDVTQEGDQILDLGSGNGYVAHLLLKAKSGTQVVCVDMNEEILAEAEDNLAVFNDRARFIVGDLRQPEHLDVRGRFKVIVSCLTFHDLSHKEKAQMLRWSADHLAENGLFLLYDRIYLTAASLFPAQVSIWNRIERVCGTAMRTAESYADYCEDIGPDNNPAALSDYMNWFAEAGLAAAPLHVHGNIALIGAAASA